MEENSVKWEVFLEENKIDESKLPENVQHKIEQFNSLFEEYDELDDDASDHQISEMEARLNAMDNGILSDLQSYVEKAKKEAESNSDDTAEASKKENGGQTNQTEQKTESTKPSWNHWL